MTEYHKKVLVQNYGKKRNLFVLSDLLGQDVPDPYGQGVEAYENVYKILWNGLDSIYRATQKTDA